MAYAQWVIIHLVSYFKSGNINIKNATLNWGKFYEGDNKDKEIPASDIDKIAIPPGTSKDINSCGRSDASSGTEGTIDLYDEDAKICTIYWDCPWGSKTNSFVSRDVNKAYVVGVGPWNSYGGAIGNVTVEVIRK